MNRVVWLLRARGSQLALWTGIALCVASQAYLWLAVQPLQERIESLQRERNAKPQAELVRIDHELERQTSPHQQLASFYGFFAGGRNVTEQLAKLYEIAKANGLEMQRAEYRMTSVSGSKLDRYQVVVPMQGSYSTIRAFVSSALRDLPTMSVDQVQFQRKAIGDSVVDGQISVSFHVPR
jgi:hypothetical protein